MQPGEAPAQTEAGEQCDGEIDEDEEPCRETEVAHPWQDRECPTENRRALAEDEQVADCGDRREDLYATATAPDDEANDGEDSREQAGIAVLLPIEPRQAERIVGRFTEESGHEEGPEAQGGDRKPGRLLEGDPATPVGEVRELRPR